jgi:hypothetical protein
VTGIAAKGRTATVLLRGSNRMVLDEADRSLHDALCCIRCLVQARAARGRGGRALACGDGGPSLGLAECWPARTAVLHPLRGAGAGPRAKMLSEPW